MKNHPALFLAGLLMTGCTYGDKLTETNALETAARDTHATFLKSDAGFGMDPAAPIFYDSFEGSALDRWVATNASTTAMSDTWHTSTALANFGTYSLTYDYGSVINKALEFGESTVTTRDAISLSKAVKPAMVVFLLFDQQGSKEDLTSFKAEISPDLGFTWTALVPVGAADPVVAAPATPTKTWKRYRYDLTSYAGQVIQLRLGLKATMSDRKLLFVDDVLIAEQK